MISLKIIRWVLASLSVLGRLHWVDKEKLTSFILACQVKNRDAEKKCQGVLIKQHRTLKRGDLLIGLATFQTLFTHSLGWQALVSWERKGSRR